MARVVVTPTWQRLENGNHLICSISTLNHRRNQLNQTTDGTINDYVSVSLRCRMRQRTIVDTTNQLHICRMFNTWLSHIVLKITARASVSENYSLSLYIWRTRQGGTNFDANNLLLHGKTEGCGIISCENTTTQHKYRRILPNEITGVAQGTGARQ